MTGRLRAAALALVLLASGTATACDGSSRADDQPADPSSAAHTATPPSGPTLDPEHAVEPPGRRTGVVGYPDIVVTSARTIEPSTAAAIRAVPGVLDVASISLAQVVVQNRALQVAAVDPATYRNYTLREVAESQEVWRRVAAGELAVDPRLVRRVPVDDHGFVDLGSTKAAPAVHIGAHAEQAPLVDAVVNETWIPDLEMTEGNALLIRTGGRSPDTLRRPIQRALSGADASVQMTDVVAREGLDPDVVQTAVVVGTVADAVGIYRYSVLGGGRIAPEPAWVASHITTEQVPILGAVTCNRLIFPQLRAALQEVVDRGLADEIHPGEYAGCYYPRFIAGSTKLSNHAFGLALDLNVPGNQRGTVGEMDRGVVAAFEHWGFTWGGRWGYTDPMHFEMRELVNPG
ncbi:M15 family metallopeptidase [Nocardioides sp. YIM 152315]|uniref:M15 family metallopeptidase n=1 Tax=Nocardioides sp. YIM 152315 TaxID=3031760 RepID=UPI0023DC1CDA|nr:M15 family metallopeptidase [Nocardioides sp. YIM 152315]MDF1604583.1 M15 family metallopeptidase [Nocardioides sp. YIM 152315]